MDLSIIIVNWNSKEFLFSCMRSIVENERGMSSEIIVVDNGSQDGSADEIKKGFPFVHLIENGRNWGFARAVNQGIQQASGRYILLLNPDTQLKNGAVGRLMAFMNAHPEAGIAGPQLLNLDGSKQNSIANFPTLVTELSNKSLLRWLFPRRFPGKENRSSEPVEVDSVIGACMMVRRDAFVQVGLLDEDYFLFLEETDWCYRMKKTGWKTFHVPQAEVYHSQGGSAEPVKREAKIEFYRSRYHYFKKNRGSLQQFLLLVGLMLRLGVQLVFMATACLFTFFAIKKWRKKLDISACLVWWHLRVCPRGMGLREEMELNPQRSRKVT